MDTWEAATYQPGTVAAWAADIVARGKEVLSPDAAPPHEPPALDEAPAAERARRPVTKCNYTFIKASKEALAAARLRRATSRRRVPARMGIYQNATSLGQKEKTTKAANRIGDKIEKSGIKNKIL